MGGLALFRGLGWFGLLLLRDFGLLGPFFVEGAIAKDNESVLGVFQLELDAEGFFFGMLRLGNEVSDMLVEANNWRLVLDEDFNGLFPCELDGLA